MHPGEARVWIQQASQWGGEVLSDTLRATAALADETRNSAAQPGFASTNPAANPSSNGYPSMPQDPNWTYVADGNQPATNLGAPMLPPVSLNGYVQPPAASAAWPNASYPVTGPSAAGPAAYSADTDRGSNYEQAGYQGQGLPYPAADGASPYRPNEEENPLRPSMAREAPWSTTGGGASAMLPTTPSAPAYQEVESKPRVGGGYPRVQWAGDWRDYRGVPETVKPMDQSQYGYLPPPDISSTAATVDRYLPSQSNQPTAQTPAPQATQSWSQSADAGVANASAYQYQYPQAGAVGPSAGPQTQLPPQTATTQTATMWPAPYQGQSLPPIQSGTGPAAPYQPPAYVATARTTPEYSPEQTSSSRHSIRVVPATPFGALSESAAQTQQPTYPSVASLPQRSAVSNAGSRPTQGAIIPRGVQMESPDPVADLTLCEGAQILTRVGSELVLMSEILPLVNETLSGVEGIENASESDLAMAREQLIRKILPQHIEMKLLYVDAKRNLPPEAITNINQQLTKRFEEVEVSERMKKLKLNSRRELEEQLAKWGTSLEQEKRAFVEKAIAQQWVFEKLRKDEEITHEELLDYYQAHAAEYEHPTRVRWEHLEVSFARHPDKREARHIIAMMGNAVQQGRPFAEVAKEGSEGVMATRGGQRDWLTQGSLKSEILDRALFSLSVGAMSPILEDETGFHIVRVVEREDAFRTPFEEIQGEIREELKNEHKQKRLKEFVEQLREEIPVKTIFDEQTADSGGSGASGGGRF